EILSLSRLSAKPPDHRHRCLLPARRERPRDRRAAEQRNEVAPVQIASKPGGESEIKRRAAEKAQEAAARITSKAAAATTETESTTSSRYGAYSRLGVPRQEP